MKTEYIHEQGVGRLNEDSYFLNGNLFGVFDGATSLNKKIYSNGLTGGALASGIAKNIFSKNNDSLFNLAVKANTAIHDEMKKNHVDTTKKESLWSTSAAVVRVEKNTLEWIQIGDSLVLILYKDGSFNLPITNYDHDSETLNMWKEVAQKTDKTIFSVMKNQITKVRKSMNIDYGVLNGEKGFTDFIRSGTEKLSDISHVLLFTDGLFLPLENPSEKQDFAQFVKLFNNGGLKEIRNHIRNIEKTDPDCRKYPRFKQHDDIAAIAIELHPVSVSNAA